MAKRKGKKSGTKRSSRRRVSGMGSTFTPLLGAVGGAIVSKMVGNMIGTRLDSKIVNGLKLAAAGFLIPKVLKGPLGAGAAAGVAAEAGVSLLKDLNVISGFYSLPTVGAMRRIAGQQQLSGARQVLSGVDLVRSSADVRRVHPANHNFATNLNSLAVLSGFAGSLDGQPNY